MAESSLLGDADRDAIAEQLGRHYAEGQIDAEDLDSRLGVVYAAATRAEAAEALAGLPSLAAVAVPGRTSWWRRRRHGEADRAGAGWVPTTERFIDPSTSRTMRVWIDPADAKRHYLAD